MPPSLASHNMNTQNKNVIHGDVDFIRVEEVPKDAKMVECKGNKYVVAEGEVTGHMHVLTVEKPEDMQIFESPAGMYFLLNKEGTATHTFRDLQTKTKDHKTIKLPPGVYRRNIEREYDPLANERRHEMKVRQVVD